MLTYLFCPLSKPVSPVGKAKIVQFIGNCSSRGRGGDWEARGFGDCNSRTIRAETEIIGLFNDDRSLSLDSPEPVEGSKGRSIDLLNMAFTILIKFEGLLINDISNLTAILQRLNRSGRIS